MSLNGLHSQFLRIYEDRFLSLLKEAEETLSYLDNLELQIRNYQEYESSMLMFKSNPLSGLKETPIVEMEAIVQHNITELKKYINELGKVETFCEQLELKMAALIKEKYSTIPKRCFYDEYLRLLPKFYHLISCLKLECCLRRNLLIDLSNEYHKNSDKIAHVKTIWSEFLALNIDQMKEYKETIHLISIKNQNT